VRVEQQAVELGDGERIVTPPETHAGRRTVKLPPSVMLLLIAHLKVYVGNDPDAPSSSGPSPRVWVGRRCTPRGERPSAAPATLESTSTIYVTPPAPSSPGRGHRP
jgi:hypothetical protein